MESCFWLSLMQTNITRNRHLRPVAFPITANDANKATKDEVLPRDKEKGIVGIQGKHVILYKSNCSIEA